MTTTQYCTFKVGDLFCGVPVAHVQEILRYQELTFVPLAPPDVSGLLNLRGQVVTALDLRQRLAVHDAPAQPMPTNVVVRVEQEPISLLVDAIEDILDVDTATVEEAPLTVSHQARRFLHGVSKLERRLLLLLDTLRLVDLRSSEAGRVGIQDRGQ